MEKMKLFETKLKLGLKEKIKFLFSLKIQNDKKII
jgi:hypothetical protein